MKPQHSLCNICGGRIARLSDRERWHHYGGRNLGHQPEPMLASRAAELIEALGRIGGDARG